MSLDTVSTPIPHRIVSTYLDRLDRRGETYEFLRVSPDEEIPISNTPSVKLTLHREGSDDPLSITLRMDGRWTAEHLLVVGEKE